MSHARADVAIAEQKMRTIDLDINDVRRLDRDFCWRMLCCFGDFPILSSSNCYLLNSGIQALPGEIRLAEK